MKHDAGLFDILLGAMSDNINDALCRIVDMVYAEVKCDYIDVRIVDTLKQHLYIIAHKIGSVPAVAGCSETLQKGRVIRGRSWVNGITGCAARTSNEVYASQLDDGSWNNRDYMPLRAETRAAYAVPLRFNGETVGVLLLESNFADFFENRRKRFELIGRKGIAQLIRILTVILRRALDERIAGARAGRANARQQLTLRITNADSLNELVVNTLPLIKKSVLGCDDCRIWLVDRKKKWMHCIGARKSDSYAPVSIEALLRELMRPGSSATPYAEEIFQLTHGLPLSVNGVMASVIETKVQRHVPNITMAHNFILKGNATSSGLSSYLCIPLVDPTTETAIGCLGLFSRSKNANILAADTRSNEVAACMQTAVARLASTLPEYAESRLRSAIIDAHTKVATTRGSASTLRSRLDEVTSIIAERLRASSVVILRRVPDGPDEKLLVRPVALRSVAAEFDTLFTLNGGNEVDLPNELIRLVSSLLDPILDERLKRYNNVRGILKLCADVGLLTRGQSYSLMVAPIVGSDGAPEGAVIVVGCADDDPYNSIDQTVLEAITRPIRDVWLLAKVEEDLRNVPHHHVVNALNEAIEAIGLGRNSGEVGDEAAALQLKLQSVIEIIKNAKTVFDSKADDHDNEVDISANLLIEIRNLSRSTSEILPVGFSPRPINVGQKANNAILETFDSQRRKISITWHAD